jgi:putative molybdopterin biosynthesis protein
VPEWVIPARLARDMPSELGFDEYIPVSVGSVNGCAWVFPHPRGSGLQMNMVRANGYLHIPLASEGWESGEWADIHCTSLPHQIERTLLCVGAKNPGIGLLADTLADNAVMLHTFEDLPARALNTLQSNSCNLVALTIPGINPIPEMFHAIRDLPVVSIHIGQMQVGIVSRNGAAISDLTRIRMVNSPRGSTGRMLIDQLLSARGLQEDQILGGLNEVKSEHAVLSAVRNGSADAGICSLAIAADSGLSFMPIIHESHTIVIRKESLDDQRIKKLLQVIQSPEFKTLLQTKYWYKTTCTGKTWDLPNDTTGDSFTSIGGLHSSESGGLT